MPGKLLEAAPRRGWVDEASPVHSAPKLAESLGLGWLGFKRDDLITALHGGTKVRKLDYLLATPPYADAPGWAGWGATGSGQLVALVAAAQELDRRVTACIFWEPASEEILQNLAFTASGPTEILYRTSRIALAINHPGVLRGTKVRGLPAVPPGATCPAGLLGTVRAGLELADQIKQGVLPAPDRIVVALGSGGTAAGLAVGLGMAGLTPLVHAVGTVERIFMTEAALARSVEQARVVAGTKSTPAPIRVDRRWIGRGYGHPTPAGLAACARIAKEGPEGLGLEGVYTGKAMAYLLAEPPPGESVLFWQTARRAGPLPAADDWRDRLPSALRRKIDGADHRRRRFLLSGAFATVGLASVGGARIAATRPQRVLAAAAEALLPPLEVDPRAVAAAAERYLAATGQARLASMALAIIEHGAPLAAGRWGRLSSLPPAEVEATLSALAGRGATGQRLYRAVRDLVMLGAYQQDDAWVGTGYPGPWVKPSDPARPDPYAHLVASDVQLPPELRR
jgi:D-cysteine desulfhydrase